MKTLFEQATPRQDVLAGELTESRFAASLEDVVTGNAASAYADANQFFAATFPSGGLKTLLNEALGRIGGGRRDGASVLRLETSLGGGKTHNLIALFHAARGRLDHAQASEFMDAALLPERPVEQVGVFVGTSTGAQSFPAVGGITPHTVWGYLALQVGGQQGYQLVRDDDEALTAPGSAALRQLLGDRPSLLLIDEIARYYSVAKGVRVGDSTLASQTTAFLMALMEAVDGLAQAVLVITTTGLTDAFGEDTAEVLKAVEEASSLMARKEVVLRPSEEADLPKILTRRLFEQISPGAAAETARAYAENADTAYSGGLDLPEHMMGSGWAGEITRTYPFHPALIKVLDKRLSTIPNFQRTRGALRLLARVIRRLWEQSPENTAVIHLHHIDLAERVIAEELSSRLERPQFETVIRTDIKSQPQAELSHAEQIDTRMASSYAQQLATTIYLYSLTRETPGVQPPELYCAVLQPGDDHNVLQKALDNLENVCWYLHGDARGYRFSTEASLVRLIQEAESEISVTKARTRATGILVEKFKDSNLRVRRAWEDAKVPDNADDAWLVLLHWDDFGDRHGVESHDEIPDKVRQLWERTPSGGVREYRNRLVILAPTSATHHSMVRAVTTHLALRELAREMIPWAVNNAVVNHEKICALAISDATLDAPELRAHARVIRGSATSLPLPDRSVDAIVTDPPYYDNVMYAEISDFFYVWLKRSLRGTWPEFTDLPLTDKHAEAVANPSLFRDVAAAPGRGRKKTDGGGRTATELANDRYEELLRKSFVEAHRVLKTDGLLTVMFTHKRLDAWDTLGAALLDAGFSINASWPVHTESENSLHQAKKNAAASTIFLACRKRESAEPAYWADIRRDVERAAEEAATRFAFEGVAGVDLTIATYGPVLSVLSRNWPVYTGELGADGNPEVLRPDAALDLARERVTRLKKRELLGGREVKFDRISDWYLLAWSDFAAAEFPYDEARKLSIALHIELDELTGAAKVIKKGSGTVTLLSPVQRATAKALKPDASDWPSWIDKLHSLMCVYEIEGLGAARAWLSRTNLAEDTTFTALFEAALLAIPRVRIKGEYARPEAGVLESLRKALFDTVDAPAELTLTPNVSKEITGTML